ncbi:MAG: restriction endonuclease subunit S [Fibrobacter sp.]|nr:restriction endonuclease subunit S [Fibrobacter sp.]
MKKEKIEKKNLGPLLTLKKGKKPKTQSPVKEKGMQPYVDIKAFETGVIGNYTDDDKCVPCNDGDLLIVCDGSRSGYVGRAIKGYTGSTLAKISAEGVDNSYLYYFIQSMYRLLNTQMKGTGTPHLNVEVLRKAELVIPSISEQKRIVDKIEELFSELDSAVETLKKTKEQLAVYRQSVLKEAFAQFSHKEKIKDLSEFVTSGSRGWAQYYSDDGARFIRITDLTRDRIVLKNDDIQYVALPDNVEGMRSRLKPNDILVSITADLGSIALIPKDIQEAYINQHIALVRLSNSEIAKFTALYLKSDWGQKDLLKNKRGGGKMGLGLDDIRNTPIPVVSTDIANKIVSQIESRLSACENIEKTVNDALIQADAMRQSILKKAFEGEL